MLVPVITVAAVSSGGEGSFAGVTSPQHVQGSATFRDRTGDAPASADVSTVSVSSDRRGFVTFKIMYVRRLSSEATTVVYIDSDHNGATGARARFGADYAVVVWGVSVSADESASSFSLRRWNGRAFKEVSSKPPEVGSTGRILTFSFDTSDLGKTRGGRFVVTEGLSGHVVDSAPDAGRIPWGLHLLPRKVVRLEAARLATKPSVPVAGDPFVASMQVGIDAPIDLLTMLDVPSCEATVAGRRLAPLRSSLLKARGDFHVTARCSWRVPPGASGELLRASVAVTFEGRKLTRSFSSRIR